MRTITSLQNELKKGKPARALVEECYALLETRQKEYNVIISLTKERALQRADEIDTARQAGKQVGRLAGIPFIAKDNFLAFEAPTTAGSAMLKNFNAPYQATAIERLEHEGAILIAKANLDAFAHGGSTENSDFGPTKNPHDPSRVPGGSSGGSAASVALDVVPFALGTDTGGSIRQPASFCGVVGVKPTYGRVSRYGVVAMASSTDVIGPLAHTVEDAALVLDIIAGKDERDSTTLPNRPATFVPKKQLPKLKLGIIKEYMNDQVEPAVRARVSDYAEKLRAQGHQLEEVSLPTLKLALAIYYIVVPAEISSNLSRYDGIRFGYSNQQAANLDELFGLTRDGGFNAENKRRILIGTYVLSSGYYDAYYRKAQTARTLLINEFANAFTKYDALLGPVTPTTAFKLGQKVNDPLQMYLSDIMTVAASLTGLPALSVPVGNDPQGLPIGLQLIGRMGEDAPLLALAQQIEELRRG